MAASSSSSLSSSWGLLAVAFVSSALLFHSVGAGATWCVARSHVSQQELQTALDYACGAGADCTPIQPDGFCFLPNTIEAHASYAFNSFYQKKGMAPGSCDFADTAAVASTDPSYGSCVYPSSASTAGGTVPVGTPPRGPDTTTTATPTTNTPNTNTPAFGGGSGGSTPLGSTDTNSDESRAVVISVNLIALSLIWVTPLLLSPI